MVFFKSTDKLEYFMNSKYFEDLMQWILSAEDQELTAEKKVTLLTHIQRTFISEEYQIGKM
jgi:hypothetical protein